MKSLLSLNTVGLLLLLGGFVVSLGMVLQRSYEAGGLGNEEGGKRIVKIMHWQLEPGYREAMQDAIDQYNQLPHVREANVEVRQLDVTERVYAQVLNVHMISGTAPDLCEQGMTAAVRNAGAAQYFESLGEAVAVPNPYNADRFLPDQIDPALRESLQTLPWRETLMDGMQGGWNSELQDYYSVPTSFFGSQKIYYNEELFGRARQLLRQAAEADPTPPWFENLFLREVDGQVSGYVTDTPALRHWLVSDREPDTLGRTLMVCEAIWEIGRQTNDDQLVPIAGSSYSDQMFAGRYRVPFLAHYVPPLNDDHSVGLDGVETWRGWLAGDWSFEDPAVIAYFECIRTICEQFPAGFLGLDREQARRRFVNAQAGMIATGSWDAKSIFDATEGEVVGDDYQPREGERITTIDGINYLNHRFPVSIMDFPLPGPGERWSEYVGPPASEAQSNGGAAYMVYQRSPNKEHALDFLRFLTSYSVNQEFNRTANWLPIVIGSSPHKNLMPFAPAGEGFSGQDQLAFNDEWAGNLATRFTGQLKNYLSGAINYQTFKQTINDAAADSRSGADRVLFDKWQRTRDQVRNTEKLIMVQTAADVLLDDPSAAVKQRAALRQSVLLHNATVPRRDWANQFPDEPFPEF
jgi:raffinose/stachyose/melibiose transport system substrate-binding protein